MLALLIHATVRCASVVVVAIAATRAAAAATAVVLRVAALDLCEHTAAAVRVANVQRARVVVIANHCHACAFARRACVTAGARAAVVANARRAARGKYAFACAGIASVARADVVVIAAQSHAADTSSALAHVAACARAVVGACHAIGRRFNAFAAQALIFGAWVCVVAFGVTGALIAATDNDRRRAFARFHIATVLRARFAVVAIRAASARAIAVLAGVDGRARVVVVARHIVGASNGIALASRRVASIFRARIAVVASGQAADAHACLARIRTGAGVVVVARVAILRLVLTFALLAAVLRARVVVVALAAAGSAAGSAAARAALAVIAAIRNWRGNTSTCGRVARIGGASVVVIADNRVAHASARFASIRACAGRFVVARAAIGRQNRCAFASGRIAGVKRTGIAIFTNSRRTGDAFAFDAGVTDCAKIAIFTSAILRRCYAQTACGIAGIFGARILVIASLRCAFASSAAAGIAACARIAIVAGRARLHSIAAQTGRASLFGTIVFVVTIDICFAIFAADNRRVRAQSADCIATVGRATGAIVAIA